MQLYRVPNVTILQAPHLSSGVFDQQSVGSGHTVNKLLLILPIFESSPSSPCYFPLMVDTISGEQNYLQPIS